MADVEYINTGAFDQLVFFDELVLEKGLKSQMQRSYINKASVYADVTMQPIAEAIVNDNIISAQKITVVTYSYSGIDNRWIIRWNGLRYNIVNVIPVKKTIFMKLECIRLQQE